MSSSPVVEHIVIFKVKDDIDPSKVNDLTSLGLTLHLFVGPLFRTRSSLFAFSHRVNAAAISESLQISIDFVRPVLDTLAPVLHLELDPLIQAKPDVIDEVEVNVHDMVLFLHIQSYKKLLPRKHKDSATVADVWLSTSAFDRYL